MSQITIKLELPDAAATDVLGQALAATAAQLGAAAGAIMYLDGELGTGKTSCVRSFLRALGVTGLIRSPTYTLVETYALAAMTCIHVDLYRLRSASEIEELGLRDMAGPGHVVFIEWPDKGQPLIPAADLMIALSYVGTGRAARLGGCTSLGATWLNHLGVDRSLQPYVSHFT